MRSARDLVGEPVGLLLPVPHADAEQDQHPRPDLGDPRALDVNGRLADPLDERPQMTGRVRAGPVLVPAVLLVDLHAAPLAFDPPLAEVLPAAERLRVRLVRPGCATTDLVRPRRRASVREGFGAPDQLCVDAGEFGRTGTAEAIGLDEGRLVVVVLAHEPVRPQDQPWFFFDVDGETDLVRAVRQARRSRSPVDGAGSRTGRSLRWPRPRAQTRASRCGPPPTSVTVPVT